MAINVILPAGEKRPLLSNAYRCASLRKMRGHNGADRLRHEVLPTARNRLPAAKASAGGAPYRPARAFRPSIEGEKRYSPPVV